MLWSLDHSAIAISCTCGFIPILVYAFECSGRISLVYICVTVAMASIVMTLSAVPAFHQEKYRPLRAMVQLSFALWAQVPLAHAFVLLMQVRDAGRQGRKGRQLWERCYRPRADHRICSFCFAPSFNVPCS